MRAVDTAEVIFLVDNATDSLSSNPVSSRPSSPAIAVAGCNGCPGNAFAALRMGFPA